MEENTTQQQDKTEKSHIRQALLWSTCPCLTSYWTFPKKRKETEVEMNAGELQLGVVVQDEKPTCTVKTEVKMRDEGGGHGEVLCGDVELVAFFCFFLICVFDLVLSSAFCDTARQA